LDQKTFLSWVLLIFNGFCLDAKIFDGPGVKRSGLDFRSGKRWAAPANPQKGNSTNLIGNSKTRHSSFHQTEMPAGDARLNGLMAKKNPHQNVVLAGL